MQSLAWLVKAAIGFVLGAAAASRPGRRIIGYGCLAVVVLAVIAGVAFFAYTSVIAIRDY